MNKRLCAMALCALLLLSGCSKNKDKEQVGAETQGGVADLGGDDESFGDPIESIGSYDGYFEEDIADVEIVCIKGTQDAYELTDGKLTFTSVSEDTAYSISGKLSGSIVIDVGEDCKFELELNGFSCVSRDACPIYISSCDKISIKAKKGTDNYIYDMRDVLDENDTSSVKSAVYSTSDTDICGKGKLTVISENNNGIHSKKDLDVENVTLLVSCKNNALKGNDSVTLTDCTTTLISKSGDSVKTTDSDISAKGAQRGCVTISGGTHTFYAARDGIDASYDVVLDGEDMSLNIYTDKYSNYSEESDSASESMLSAFDDFELTRGPGGGMGGGPGFGGGFGGGMGGDPGFGGGFGGGMNDGNQNKNSYSSKGIKAANEINIICGNVNIKSYDDSIHAGSSEALENGNDALGNINISGGNISLYTNDDGIHADGCANVSGGTVSVLNSYEGIEGNSVIISGGYISINASDDGINGTATSGEAVSIKGGVLYVYCGGDGIDSNSRSSYEGIVFYGGNAVIISTSSRDSAIDTEQGYTYIGGNVLAIMSRGGMISESTHCSNFSKIGKTLQTSLSKDGYLCADIGDLSVIVRMPCSMSAAVIVLGSSSAEIDIKSSVECELDTNGVCWK